MYLCCLQQRFGLRICTVALILGLMPWEEYHDSPIYLEGQWNRKAKSFPRSLYELVYSDCMHVKQVIPKPAH